MTITTTTSAVSPSTLSASLFRIDKFIVPPASMPAFLARLRHVMGQLGSLPGCRQNLVLTQSGGPGEFNVVTLVEWANAEAMGQARVAMEAFHAQEGFDTEAFRKQLGIRVDQGTYTLAAAGPGPAQQPRDASSAARPDLAAV